MGLAYNIILFFVVLWALIDGLKIGFKNQHFLFLSLFITFLIDVILQAEIILNNLPSFNGTYYKFYLIFCINFFAVFYAYIFQKKRRIVLIALSVLLNLSLIFTVDFTDPFFENHLGVSLPVFYILLALMWFQHKLTQNAEEKITDNPYFWVSSGLLIWGGFFLFRIIPAKYLFENDPAFNQFLKSMNFMVGSIMYLLFFVALLKFKKQIKKT